MEHSVALNAGEFRAPSSMGEDARVGSHGWPAQFGTAS